ncbi:Calcium/calmodulin-dependent 3',5'-cyclic nucleotide phosphodiesterase 1C [Cichlidogyrus casuarinus]|uniref:Phosphodiesterase n=1 Tax=Cichlidogyrus casuarinus TaxID=1844966 RepID=A0ABD2QM92_9PLAT
MEAVVFNAAKVVYYLFNAKEIAGDAGEVFSCLLKCLLAFVVIRILELIIPDRRDHENVALHVETTELSPPVKRLSSMPWISASATEIGVSITPPITINLHRGKLQQSRTVDEPDEQNRAAKFWNSPSCDELDVQSGSLEMTKTASARIRRLIELVLQNKITKRELLDNLSIVTDLLKRLFLEQKSELLDRDLEIPEWEDEDDEEQQESDSARRSKKSSLKPMPTEVKSWLEATFMKPHRPESKEKWTFRKAARMIKARIKLERMFGGIQGKPTFLMSPEGENILKTKLHAWDFDVFALNNYSDNHAIIHVGFALLDQHRLLQRFRIMPTVLECFLLKVEQGYSLHNNPYHNLIHAADVAQTCNSIIHSAGIVDLIDDVDKLAIIFSAIIHDLEHTGTTNAFHVNTGSTLAILYNDRGVQENHHVSAAYRIMKMENANIFQNLTEEEFREVRSAAIEIVLNTDMSLHFQQLKSLSKMISLPEPLNKLKAYSLLLHSADISHPTKTWDLHERWTKMLVEEFFRQGDRETELGLPCSPLCDRKTTVVAQSQIGFIEFIVSPTFVLLNAMLEKLVKQAASSELESEEVDVAPIKLSESKFGSSKFPTDVPDWCDLLEKNRTNWSLQASVKPPETDEK